MAAAGVGGGTQETEFKAEPAMRSDSFQHRTKTTVNIFVILDRLPGVRGRGHSPFPLRGDVLLLLQGLLQAGRQHLQGQAFHPTPLLFLTHTLLSFKCHFPLPSLFHIL
jgi:hypothetical protein